jgi:uncharacterized protein (TIGR02611 family)
MEANERVEPPGEPPREKPSLAERLRARRHHHRHRHIVIRALFVIAGFTLLAGGIAMLVLPGPAFVVIPIGLAMLSLEFLWAERAMEKALAKAEEAKEKASRTSTGERVLIALGVLCAIGAAVAAELHWHVI